jgi:trimeric autotransporter adhesin
MKKLLLILLCLPMVGFGQFTFVPDDNFEQALINLGVDWIFDDYVETAGIDTITYLYLSNNGILDLTGIENFTLLREFSCSNNSFTTLDLSNNPELYEVNCSINQLTSLDVRNGNNQGLLYCTAMNNPGLNCIDVDDVAWANNNWSKDSWTTFSTNCSPTGIKDSASKRKLIKVLDVFGRSVTPKPNMTLLYIYSDGSTEKKLIIK